MNSNLHSNNDKSLTESALDSQEESDNCVPTSREDHDGTTSSDLLTTTPISVLRPRDYAFQAFLRSSCDSDGSLIYDTENGVPSVIEAIQEGPDHWGQVRKVGLQTTSQS